MRVGQRAAGFHHQLIVPPELGWMPSFLDRRLFATAPKAFGRTHFEQLSVFETRTRIYLMVDAR